MTLTPISFCFIGTDCNSNTHFNDYSNAYSKIHTIGITYNNNEAVLVFTLYSENVISKVNDIKAQIPNQNLFFVFCDNEFDLLSKFIQSFSKGIETLCTYTQKEIDFLKYRCDINFVPYTANGINIFKYDAILSNFSTITDAKYSSLQMTYIARLLQIQNTLPKNIYNTSNEFILDVMLYYKYVYEYCMLFYNIDAKLGLFEAMVSGCNMTGVDMNAILSSVMFSNSMMRNEYAKRGLHYVINSKKGSSGSYEGAKNFKPTHSFVRNVLAFDMKAFYINIQIAFKMSPENICYDDKGDRNVITCKNGVKFYSQTSKEETICESIQKRIYEYR